MSVIVFGNIAKLGTDGIPQILFYMTGNAIWGYFSSCLAGNASTFTGNAGLFGKVYFARLTMPLSNVLSNVIRFGIQMIVVVILMIYYASIGSIEVHPVRWLLIPPILIVLGLMGMGCGILASSLTTKYRDLSVLISFGLSLWMYATPVIYPLSQLAGSPFLGMLLWNPVTVPVELFRFALFGVGTIWLPGLAVTFLFTAVAVFLGIIVFNRVERTFMDTV
jgi:lipopolysaccharide transport system permease protein